MFKVKNIVVLFTVLAALGLSGDVWGMNGEKPEEKLEPATVLGFKGNTIYRLTKVSASFYNGPTIVECNQLLNENTLLPVILEDNSTYYLYKKELEATVDTRFIKTGNITFSWVDLGAFEKGNFILTTNYINSSKDLREQPIKMLQTSAILKKNLSSSVYVEHEQVKEESKKQEDNQQADFPPLPSLFELRNDPIIWKTENVRYEDLHNCYLIPTAIPRILHWAIPTLCATILGGLQEYLAIKKYNPGISYGITALPAIAQPLHSVKSAQRTGWTKWIPVFTSGAGYLAGKYATRYVNQIVAGKNSGN